MGEREHLVSVGQVGVRAAVEEQPHGLDVAGSALAEENRFQQGGPAEPVDLVDLDAGAQEPGDDARVAALGGADEAGAVVAVLRGELQALVTQ